MHCVAVSGASRDRVLTVARLVAAREPQDHVGITLTRRAQRSETSTMAAESQICHYRRVSLLPGLRANFSKSGASVSIGRRGSWLTAGPRGRRRITAGIPGTGIYWTESAPPAPPVEEPLPKDQTNLTDADSRIMPASGGGFEQSYNAQAVVAAGSLLVVAADVVQAPNDKQQLEPMLDKIEALADELGKPENLLADTGYFSAANIAACEKAGIEPLIAMGRQPHHPPLAERF